MRKKWISFKETFNISFSQAALTGVMIYFAYTLVFVSLAFVRNVSHAAAFRQLSVPLGALGTIFFLKESRHLSKLLGITLMFADLVLIATG